MYFIELWLIFCKFRSYERSELQVHDEANVCTTRREFFREILYKNIAIIAIQHSKIYLVDTFGDSSHTVE